LVQDLEASINGQEFVKQVQTTIYQENENSTQILNSKGLNLAHKNTFAYVYAVGVFEKGEDIKTAYDIKIAKQYNEFNVSEMAQKTLEKGRAKLGGTSLKSGAYPVVFSNDMFADILGVYSSIFTGEAAYRNLTALKDKVGEKIALESFTLIDDPLHPDAYFQSAFDDEGVACHAFSLVDQGVFKGWMHNLKTAMIFNEEPTGHASGGGIRPTNLYLKPTDVAFEDLIQPIQDGVYITDLVGLHAGVKTVSGDFSLQAGGFRIENGKVTTPVKMIVVSGNFFTMINAIEGIGSDLKFGLGSTGSPSVYIKELMIGGE
jgi:PmbA protein